MEAKFLHADDEDSDQTAQLMQEVRFLLLELKYIYSFRLRKHTYLNI